MISGGGSERFPKFFWSLLKKNPVLWRTPTPEYSGVEQVLFFTPERRVGAESLKAPESVSGVLRVFQDII